MSHCKSFPLACFLYRQRAQIALFYSTKFAIYDCVQYSEAFCDKPWFSSFIYWSACHVVVNIVPSLPAARSVGTDIWTLFCAILISLSANAEIPPVILPVPAIAPIIVTVE